MHHYVYKIEFLEVPHIYFGSRTSKCLPEEDVKYLGSPRTFKHYWKDYTPIKTILVTGFKNREDANKHEKELILSQWENNKTLSLNAYCADQYHVLGKPGYWTGRTDSPLKGGKLTAETCAKLSAVKKGVPKSREHANKIGAAHAREYVAISPDGEIIRFVNSVKFCESEIGIKNKFNFVCISRCANGINKTHRKWKFYFYEDFLKMKEAS